MRRTRQPYWPPTVVPPKGAPNVLLIITDDVGFGAPSTFGGLIPTPTLDRIANGGLRYTQFHSTALCSPTRAALITGRNHHSVGFGVITEISTGYPGYNSVITKDKATIGTILKDNGYATSWFGKNHNTPSFQASQAGPFDQWPIGMGFDYFYGFMGGETNQWQPGNLVRNTTPIYPYVGKPGWNLITAMADDAIDYVNQLNALAPEKPFLLYYAPGGTHAPHHPTPEWIAKFKGKFDMGWNAARDQIFANQKRLGVIPQDAKLTPWPDDLLKNWDDLSADEKKLYARQMEVYAAYLAYTDHEIGRVIQAIEDMGKLDNTLIIYISGDNGSSAEGTPNGTPNEMTTFNGDRRTGRGPIEILRRLGFGPDLSAHGRGLDLGHGHALQMDQADRVAFRRHAPGHGNLMAEPDQGCRRNPQPVPPCYRHRADHPRSRRASLRPSSVDGIAQKPIEGVSMAYTFDKANAGAPSKRTTQYFEMFGMRALYHEGWIASTTPIPGAVEDHRSDAQGRGQRGQVGTLQHHQGLDPVRRCGGRQSGQTQGTAGSVLGGGAKVSGAATRRFGLHARRRSAPEHYGRTDRVHLHKAGDRHPSWQRTEHFEQILRHHCRSHRSSETAATACS